MEQSVDKRLEAIEILRKWVSISWRENPEYSGQAICKLMDGEEEIEIEMYIPIYEAELLGKVLN